MTHDDAVAVLASRPCDRCHRVGVELFFNPNNHSTSVRCPSCGAAHAWSGVQYLKMTTQKRRKPAPSRLELDAVWQRFDNHCCVCDRHHFEIGSLCLGRQVHHAPSYSKVGHEGHGLPVCTECHELLNWRQRCVVVR